MRSQEEINDLVQFVRGLYAQLEDVRELKAKYAQEDELNNYRMPWRQVSSDRQIRSAVTATPARVRFAPDIGPQESERIYKLLPEGWFTLASVQRRLHMNGTEVRRCFFWMIKRDRLIFSTQNGVYRKLLPNEKVEKKKSARFFSSELESRIRLIGSQSPADWKSTSD